MPSVAAKKSERRMKRRGSLDAKFRSFVTKISGGATEDTVEELSSTKTAAPPPRAPASKARRASTVRSSATTSGAARRNSKLGFASPLSLSSATQEDLSSRDGDSQDAANLAAAMAEARRLVREGVLTVGEMRQIEAVDALAADETESYEKRVLQWRALAQEEQTPSACVVIVRDLLEIKHEPVLALDFLREHAKPRGWLRSGGIQRRDSRSGASVKDRADARAAVLMRQYHATALFACKRYETCKGLILDLHAEGRANINILALLGRTQLELGVRAKSRGSSAEIAESEMASARSVFLEAFKAAKRKAGVELDGHHARFRAPPSSKAGEGGGGASYNDSDADAAVLAASEASRPRRTSFFTNFLRTRSPNAIDKAAKTAAQQPMTAPSTSPSTTPTTTERSSASTSPRPRTSSRRRGASTLSFASAPQFAPESSASVAAAAALRERRASAVQRKLVWEARYYKAMAARIHDDWRAKRMMPNGQCEPRYKVADSKVHDIANTAFNALPVVFQQSNLRAAQSACSCVDDALAMGVPLDAVFVEMAAKVQHDDWMQRPSSRGQGTLKLHVPFAELSEMEKQKDRDIIYLAIRTNHDLRMRGGASRGPKADAGGNLVWGTTERGSWLDGPTTDVTEVSHSALKTALHAGTELARTARMTGKKALAISTAYEVISLGSLLPLASSDIDSVVQVSLGEVHLHIGEFGRSIAHYQLAARLMSRNREWEEMQKMKAHSLRTFNIVSSELLKDQIMRVVSSAERAGGAGDVDDKGGVTGVGEIDSGIVEATERMDYLRGQLASVFEGNVPCVTLCVGDSFGSGDVLTDLESVGVAQISELVEEVQCGFAFAMALPGADVVFLETVLGRGGDIYIVLPCPRAEFEVAFLGHDSARDTATPQLRRPEGNQWSSRIATLLQRAKRVYEVGLAGALHNPSAMEYCFRVMAGLSIAHAQKVGAQLEVVTITTPVSANTSSTAAMRLAVSDIVNHVWREWRWDPLVLRLGQTEEWVDDTELDGLSDDEGNDDPWNAIAPPPGIDPANNDSPNTARKRLMDAAKKIRMGIQKGEDLDALIAQHGADGSPIGSAGMHTVSTPRSGGNEQQRRPSISGGIDHHRRPSLGGISPLPSTGSPQLSPARSPQLMGASSPNFALAPMALTPAAAPSTAKKRTLKGRTSRDSDGSIRRPVSTPIAGGGVGKRRGSFRLGKGQSLSLHGAERLGEGIAPPSKVRAKLAGELVQGRRQDVVGVLFADAVGFSKLREVHMYSFIRAFLGRIGELVEDTPVGSERRPIVTNTWGDGIFMAFNTVRAAGHFALQLARAVKLTDWTAFGLPKSMNVRVGVHAGPAISLTDPLTGRPNLIGPHISHAARIEPITPHGEVCVWCMLCVPSHLQRCSSAPLLSPALFAHVLRRYGSFQFAALLHLEESLAASGSITISPFIDIKEGDVIEPPTPEEQLKAHAEGMETQ